MAIVMYEPKQFGKNLGLILKQLEITQADFAAKAQLTPAAVSQIIDGKRDPSLETICRILGVIPVTFERLMK